MNDNPIKREQAEAPRKVVKPRNDAPRRAKRVPRKYRWPGEDNVARGYGPFNQVRPK